MAGIILAIAVAWWVRRWTKSGKAPDTALKCLNCPKLLESKRRWTVAWVCTLAAWVATMGWWGWSVAQH